MRHGAAVLCLRFVQDWSFLADPEQREVLELIPDGLEEKAARMAPRAVLFSLEDTRSDVLLVSERYPIATSPDPVSDLNQIFERIVRPSTR
jgi:hypothetical protein